MIWGEGVCVCDLCVVPKTGDHQRVQNGDQQTLQQHREPMRIGLYPASFLGNLPSSPQGWKIISGRLKRAGMIGSNGLGHTVVNLTSTRRAETKKLKSWDY